MVLWLANNNGVVATVQQVNFSFRLLEAASIWDEPPLMRDITPENFGKFLTLCTIFSMTLSVLLCCTCSYVNCLCKYTHGNFIRFSCIFHTDCTILVYMGASCTFHGKSFTWNFHEISCFFHIAYTIVSSMKYPWNFTIFS